MDGLAKLNNAVRSGDTKKVERLLDNELRGKNIINQVSKDHSDGGMFPLRVACQITDSSKREGMIKLLLRRGADVNLQDRHGWTVLMRAVKEGVLKLVRFLLAKEGKRKGYGVKLEISNRDTATALMIAM